METSKVKRIVTTLCAWMLTFVFAVGAMAGTYDLAKGSIAVTNDGDESGQLVVQGENSVRDAEPVSYTHLDVYKRQG